MSGFEDDFGEMVESAPTLDDVVDLLEPTPVEHTEDTVGELLTQEDVEVKETEIETVAELPEEIPIVTVELKEKEEPQVIKEWREKQIEHLKAKDEEEEIAKTDLKAQAAKELEDWYAQNEISLEKLRATNRESMNSEEKPFVAEMEPVEPGTEWERVAKLCDFNPATAKNVKDVSRLRSMILQLKQGPVTD
eukprot:TRINITY_DN7567_c0_g1_i2.p1 TRINITY_DN7567_c0_g1~~TRINITY_DN7567_c0_g1_i2.p1  ORF type:complete len:212 (-),score=62.73 TRINITY_DN7567_c0_g1_i2:131-706(-)